MSSIYFSFRPQSVNPDAILRTILASEHLFTQSTVYGGYRQRIVDPDSRDSMSLANPFFDEVGVTITRELEHTHNLLPSLGLPEFRWGKTETTCVAFGHGNRFTDHADALPWGYIPRRLTWVYYVQLEPRLFRGGELVLKKRGFDPAIVAPEHGLLVAFDPPLRHEVLPVVLTSNAFRYWRFTVTGFVYERATTFAVIKEFGVNRIVRPTARQRHVRAARSFVRARLLGRSR